MKHKLWGKKYKEKNLLKILLSYFMSVKMNTYGVKFNEFKNIILVGLEFKKGPDPSRNTNTKRDL